jgi:hypothetical protein
MFKLSILCLYELSGTVKVSALLNKADTNIVINIKPIPKRISCFLSTFITILIFLIKLLRLFQQRA